jgi:hypothetical protein
LIDGGTVRRALFLGVLALSPLRAAETRVHLMFVGDVMGHDAQIASARTADGSHDYRHNYLYIKPILDHADLAVANLEVTLAGEPYKGYPRFSSPDALADALEEAGFDLLLTANNHACDRNEEGLLRTLRTLDERNIPHTGTFASPEERELTYPRIVDVKGVRLAFLNATYGTNMLKVSTPPSVNYLDEKQLEADVAKARAAKADFILAALHWGVEYERGAHPSQKQLARRLDPPRGGRGDRVAPARVAGDRFVETQKAPSGRFLLPRQFYFQPARSISRRRHDWPLGTGQRRQGHTPRRLGLHPHPRVEAPNRRHRPVLRFARELF